MSRNSPHLRWFLPVCSSSARTGVVFGLGTRIPRDRTASECTYGVFFEIS
jgi:hypothetical protein